MTTFLQGLVGGSLILKVAFNLLLAEVLFSTAHCIMHTNPTLMELHVLHHCSTFSSWNTNLLFHPIDLALGPALGLLGMHYLVWNKDELALLVTYLIFQLWYAYDHDEMLGLYHTVHHARCNSLYAIYCNVKGSPRCNLLQQQVRKLPLEWPTTTVSVIGESRVKRS